MKRTGLTAVVIGVALIAGGCTKTGVVKKEEPVAGGMAARAPEKHSPAQAAGDASEAGKDSRPTPVADTETTGAPSAKRGTEGSLEPVLFDYDSPVLSSEARDVLNRDYRFLKERVLQGKVQIEGHCDERGSDEYNLALGEKRATAALRYLVTLGIPAEKLSPLSYGKEKPADQGHDESAWVRNRRAELIVIK